MSKLAVLCALVVALAASAGPASAFTLDKSLSGSGIDRLPVGDGDTAGAETTAVMADGRIVVGGYARQGPSTGGAIVRLTPGGDADPAFAANTSFPGTVLVPAVSSVTSVALAPDGSIYFAGDTSSGTVAGHLLADGTPDPAFGSPGRPGVVDVSPGGVGARIALGPGGAIYVMSPLGPEIESGGTRLTKLLANGTPDKAFGPAGTGSSLLAKSAGDPDAVYSGAALTVDAQGRPVMGGDYGVGVYELGFVARFATDGALDPSFGGDEATNPADPDQHRDQQAGVEFAPFDAGGGDIGTTEGSDIADANISALVIAPDGKIVTAGQSVGSGADAAYVGRFTASGKPDFSFQDRGFTGFRVQSTPDRRNKNHTTAVRAVTLDGSRIVVTGAYETRSELEPGHDTSSALFIAGLKSDGDLDKTAAPGPPKAGLFVPAIGGGRVGLPSAAVTAGGKILIVGHATSIGRRNPDPQDPSDFLLIRLGEGTPAADTGPDGHGAGPGCTQRSVKVRATLLTGCFTTKGSTEVADEGSTVMMNGTRIALLNGTSLVAEPSTGVIRTTTKDGPGGTARISQVIAGGKGVVNLSKGAIDWKVAAGGGARAHVAGNDEPQACKPIGTQVGTVSTAGVGNLLGFSLPGTARVSSSGGKTYVQVNVALPKPTFVDARGCATLVTTPADGLTLSSLHIDVGTAAIGPLSFGSISIDYSGAADTWTGTLTTTVPLPAPAPLKGTITFVSGDFKSARVDADFSADPFPVLPPAVALAGAHADVDVKVPEIGGGIHLVAGPSIFGLAAIDADLDGAISFPGKPYAIGIDIDGQVRVVTIPVATAHVHYDTGGTFLLNGNADILGIVTVGVKGGVQGHHFFLEGSTGLDLGLLSLQAKGLISEVGAAACGSLTIHAVVKDITVAAGASIEWSKGPLQLPDPFTGCDLSPFETFRTLRSARARQAGAPPAQSFTVPAGTKALGLRIDGSGGAPLVDLVGPDGVRVPGPAAAASSYTLASALPQPGAGGSQVALAPKSATYALLTAPAAGTWQIVPHVGSPAIAGVQSSRVLPQPKVTASVAGHGARRRLSYTETPQPGQTVRFVERAKRVEHVIAVPKAGFATGATIFHPGGGAGGRRSVVALVSQDGLPRTEITVAHYVAPAPRRPARPGAPRLRVSSSSSVTATWHRVARAVRYVVRAELKDGHRATIIVPAKGRLSARFVAFLPKRGGVVTITAIDGAGLTSPAARATLRTRRPERKRGTSPQHCPPPGTAGSALCRSMRRR